jgi:hypothetical protein
MDGADLIGSGRFCDEHAGAQYVCPRCARLGQRFTDDLEARPKRAGEADGRLI